jgi:hypothetical protein
MLAGSVLKAVTLSTGPESAAVAIAPCGTGSPRSSRSRSGGSSDPPHSLRDGCSTRSGTLSAATPSSAWVAWLSSRLDVPDDEKAPLATLLMAAVDGQVVLFPTDLSHADAAMARLVRLLER